MFKELDTDTLLLLFGLFMVIEGIRSAGVIDAAANLFYTVSGDNRFLLYTLIVFASVILSAFIDNIPYVATMLPVVQSIRRADERRRGHGALRLLFWACSRARRSAAT